eukprot:GGOE01003813.1.p1 GENE.GGOE01003813.1~~GGOE01003813.1.p1  ORF type:complete len:635 (+),score=100.64 GGOE01003813.1:27-1931(+)
MGDTDHQSLLDVSQSWRTFGTHDQRPRGISALSSRSGAAFQSPQPTYADLERLIIPTSMVPYRPMWHQMTAENLRWPEFLVIIALATSLALVAGMVNAITVLSALHVTAGNLTGLVTKAGIYVAVATGQAAIPLGLISAFLLGAAISGAVVGSEVSQLGPIFAPLMMLQSLVLAVSYFLYETQWQRDAMFINAFACGLQNALGTSYCGSIVRTTHVTGAATDIGIVLGHLLQPKGRVGDLWKLNYLLPLVVAFFMGGILASKLYREMQYGAMLVPSGIMLMLGSIHILIWVAAGCQSGQETRGSSQPSLSRQPTADVLSTQDGPMDSFAAEPDFRDSMLPHSISELRSRAGSAFSILDLGYLNWAITTVTAARRPTWYDMKAENLRRREYGVIIALTGTLAFMGGMVNAITSLSTLDVTAGNLTGLVTRAGISVGDGSPWLQLCQPLSMLGSFLLGSFTSGLVLDSEGHQLDVTYGPLMALQAVALCVGHHLYFTRWRAAVMCINAYTCGVQNAMGTTYCGSIVRTTHVTGATTDIGIVLGHILKAKALTEDAWKLKYLVPLVTAFFAGGVLGDILFVALDYNAILVPAVIGVALSLTHHLLYAYLPYSKAHLLVPSSQAGRVEKVVIEGELAA